MNFSYLCTFFLKEHERHTITESLLLEKLKPIVKSKEILLYENITIFHHQYSFCIPLLLLDINKGIYIFEYKTWSYKELKNSKIEKANELNSASNTLAFEKAHTIIGQKFNEITHENNVPVYNYLLMENLRVSEYQNLNTEIQSFLPEDKIIFKDSSENQIIQKLSYPPNVQDTLPSASVIIGTILVQYSILNRFGQIQLCTHE